MVAVVLVMLWLMQWMLVLEVRLWMRGEGRRRRRVRRRGVRASAAATSAHPVPAGRNGQRDAGHHGGAGWVTRRPSSAAREVQVWADGRSMGSSAADADPLSFARVAPSLASLASLPSLPSLASLASLAGVGVRGLPSLANSLFG